MKKIAAIILLSCFSAILVSESFAIAFADFNTLELFEKDTENNPEEDQKDKELSDDYFSEMMHELISFGNHARLFDRHSFTLIGEYAEINLPPPELV